MRYFFAIPTFAVFCFLTVPGCQSKPDHRAEIEQAEQKISELAADLDGRRTETGAHVRVPADEITDEDPWGTTYKISYSQSPKSDVITVRSAGPDRVFNSDDDLVAKSPDAAAGEAPAAQETAGKPDAKTAAKRDVQKGDAKGDKKSTAVAKAEKKGASSGSTTGSKPKPAAAPRETVRDTIAPRKATEQASPPVDSPADAGVVVACDCECVGEPGCRIVRRILSRRRPNEWIVHWEVEE